MKNDGFLKSFATCVVELEKELIKFEKLEKELKNDTSDKIKLEKEYKKCYEKIQYLSKCVEELKNN